LLSNVKIPGYQTNYIQEVSAVWHPQKELHWSRVAWVGSVKRYVSNWQR
jgi:hypothetical protein